MTRHVPQPSSLPMTMEAFCYGLGVEASKPPTHALSTSPESHDHGQDYSVAAWKP